MREKQAETIRGHAGTEERWHLSPKTGAEEKLGLRCAPGDYVGRGPAGDYEGAAGQH